MIRGSEIADLVELLETRNTSLFHACQFTDFKAYLRLGGIPSRALLEKKRESFTPFETDDIDQDNDVWDKVFLNLSDYGCVFAIGGNGVPNAFGPIALQIRPSALREATDVAVCLRSAGAIGFDRQQEALGCTDEVDNLFLYEAEVDFPESTFVRFGEQLQEISPGAVNPEISCSVDKGCILISEVIVAWTDPYEVSGRPLIWWVKDAMNQAGVDFPIWERSSKEERRALYGELLSVLYPPTMSLYEIAKSQRVSQLLQEWADELLARDLDYQFRLYEKYLAAGTIQPLIKRQADFEAD